jgi:regulation of enolase protein 1 (concanavalin A-like superfamily)
VAFVSAPAFAAPVDIRISAAGDDFEESVTNAGAMDSGSSDLEIPYENAGTPTGNNEQVVGLRFTPVPIGKGAQVTKAYVELEMDETKGNTQVVNVIIEGQLIAHAPAFSTASKDITNRTPTKAQVKWTIPTGLANDTKFQSPDISSILNEIMSQAGWASGNAIVIMIRDDKSSPSAGVRCTEAVEGESTAAPLLHIEMFDPSASAPNPADGATGVSMALLGWTKGDGAILHNIYFGTTPDLTEANLVAKNQPFAMYYHVAGLEPGMKYYWRVDEIDATGQVTTGAVWSFSAPSRKAFDPSPKNGAKYIAADAKLTWTLGYGAQTHTVYFGNSFEEVDKASGGTPQAAPTYAPAGPLAQGTTYYWRVDESDGQNTHKGDVWSFTTMPEIKITNPDLVGWWMFEEGAGTTALDFSGHGNDATLGGGAKWVDGVVGGGLQLTASGYVVIDGVTKGITSTNLSLSAWIKTTQASEGNVFAANDASSGHPLMFGISGGNPYAYDNGAGTQYPAPTGAVSDNQWHMLTFVRNGGSAYIYLDGTQIATYSSTFSLSTVTRWSIGQEWDGTTPSDFYTGLVDDVRIYNKALTADEVKELMRGDPQLAWKPKPDDKSTVDVIKAEQGMAWSPGDDAKQHDVYLGTDKAAVAAATAADTTGIYRGRQAQASFTPAEPLGWGTGPYYWRVDEVQDNGTITTGTVWSFSVANFLIVDDMESYTDDEGSRIYETWVDGWTNNTGAVVGNLTAPFAERTIIHGGLQAMPMDFNNAKTPFYSEAEQTFSPLKDWTSNGVDTLSLWVRGNPVRLVDKGNGAFTVGASGHDIWDNADDFRFVYKRLSGNGSITVKVESLTNTNVWAKAGVMIRDSLDAGSQMAYMIESFSSGVSFGWRQNMGLACGSATQAGVVAPQWVKLTRTGNAFTAQYSADGKTWTDIKDATTGQVVSTTIGMGASVYIGLCVTSHNTAATTTAELSGAATTGGVTGAWQQAWIGDDPDRTNGTGNVYVAVEDSAGKVAVASDPALVNAGVWTEWKIPLSSFAGVNLAKVKKLYIGVGDRKNPSAGGAGRLYIDDIRLTKP